MITGMYKFVSVIDRLSRGDAGLKIVSASYRGVVSYCGGRRRLFLLSYYIQCIDSS